MIGSRLTREFCQSAFHCFDAAAAVAVAVEPGKGAGAVPNKTYGDSPSFAHVLGKKIFFLVSQGVNFLFQLGYTSALSGEAGALPQYIFAVDGRNVCAFSVNIIY